MNNTATFENSLISLSYLGKMLLVDYKKRAIIDLKAAKKSIQEREKFTKNAPTLIIADFSKIEYVTTEARSFFAGPSNKTTMATAIIISSKIQEVMGKIYIKFNKPKTPVKLFTRISDAQEWLQTFIKS
ncbi:MAG: hypothetical protein J7604_13875 [Sporocytophaga sp.]|uniref:DUF7793 family protein n=1 Tax=Sporocytophaga sp. TaxID=2231183 RepID=UPI001B251B25|nr:hypothetical protein [Sporocytophaga sp.]MBO9701293.1 hypothetical protein [Sporocytophaga sp.]